MVSSADVVVVAILFCCACFIYLYCRVQTVHPSTQKAAMVERYAMAMF